MLDDLLTAAAANEEAASGSDTNTDGNQPADSRVALDDDDGTQEDQKYQYRIVERDWDMFDKTDMRFYNQGFYFFLFVYFSLVLSLNLFLSLSFFFSLSLSLSHSVDNTQYNQGFYFFLFVYFSLVLSLNLFLSLSFFFSLSLSLSHSVDNTFSLAFRDMARECFQIGPDVLPPASDPNATKLFLDQWHEVVFRLHTHTHTHKNTHTHTHTLCVLQSDYAFLANHERWGEFYTDTNIKYNCAIHTHIYTHICTFYTYLFLFLSLFLFITRTHKTMCMCRTDAYTRVRKWNKSRRDKRNSGGKNRRKSPNAKVVKVKTNKGMSKVSTYIYMMYIYISLYVSIFFIYTYILYIYI